MAYDAILYGIEYLIYIIMSLVVESKILVLQSVTSREMAPQCGALVGNEWVSGQKKQLAKVRKTYCIKWFGSGFKMQMDVCILYSLKIACFFHEESSTWFRNHNLFFVYLLVC